MVCVCMYEYLLQVSHRVQVDVLKQVFSGEDPVKRHRKTKRFSIFSSEAGHVTDLKNTSEHSPDFLRSRHLATSANLL